MRDRIGIVDLGSNTTRMIVMAYQPHYAFKLVSEIKETVRLIEGAAVKSILQDGPMERAVRAVRMFGALARATEVPRIIGVATSAVRDARNQAELLWRIQQQTGVEFRVVSGEQEAYYGELGVVNRLTCATASWLTSAAAQRRCHGARARPRAAVSLPAGALRLTERYLGSNQASNRDFKALEDSIAASLAGSSGCASPDDAAGRDRRHDPHAGQHRQQVARVPTRPGARL